MPTGINKTSGRITPDAEIRHVPSIPEYGTSADGKVWSFRNSKYRATRPMKRGYLRVNLSIKNKVRDRYVHQLVAEAWIPNPSSFPMLNHKDGNKKNNSVKNLEWCTCKHNINHSVELGMHKRGELSIAAKLTTAQVKLIRGSTEWRPLARRLGISSSTIYDVRKRKSWKHIP